MVHARLERHVRRRAASRVAGHTQRVDFRMGLAGELVPAFPNDLTLLGEHAADHRIRMRRVLAQSRKT
jgi:hypothetical protein